MRAGALTVGLLSEAIQAQIVCAMAGGFKALTIPEDYEVEVLPRALRFRPVQAGRLVCGAK